MKIYKTTTKILLCIYLISGLSQLALASSDVNSYDENGDTPLTKAIFQKDVLAVKQLLDAGADPYKTKQGDWANAINFMIWSENREIQRLILNHRDGMVGDTLLIKAVYGQDEYMVKTLLEMGVSPLERKSDDSADSLDFAFWGENDEIRNLIFNHQFSDKNGNTPLMQAILSENVSVVKKLIVYGASRDIQNNSGKTAGDLAKMSKHIEIQQAVNNEFNEVSIGYIDAFKKLNQLMEEANQTGQKIGSKDYFKLSTKDSLAVNEVLSNKKLKVYSYENKVNTNFFTFRSTEGKLPHNLLMWYQYTKSKIKNLRKHLVSIMKYCYHKGLPFEIHGDKLTLPQKTLATLAESAEKRLQILKVFALDDLIREEVRSFAEKVQFLKDSEEDFGHRTIISDYNLKRIVNLLPVPNFRIQKKSSEDFHRQQYLKYEKYLLDLNPSR